jgi:hypothetical protein
MSNQENTSHLLGVTTHPKLALVIHNADLDICFADLTLKSFFQCEDCGVNGILKFHLVIVALFKECLCIDHVLACFALQCKESTDQHRTKIPKEIANLPIAHAFHGQ